VEGIATQDLLERIRPAVGHQGVIISYAYGSHGLITQMSRSLGMSYVSGVGYNVLSQPREYTLGSGTTATASLRYYGLDSGTYPFGALKTIQLQQGTSPMLVDREMSYDQAGNVTAVNDRVSGENIAYCYDDLDRLSTAGTPVGESYAYNQIGNITAKNGVSYSYGDTAHVHAATAFGGPSFSTLDSNEIHRQNPMEVVADSWAGTNVR
jgi:YD repeat-containing protein